MKDAKFESKTDKGTLTTITCYKDTYSADAVHKVSLLRNLALKVLRGCAPSKMGCVRIMSPLIRDVLVKLKSSDESLRGGQ